jgi:hypothetical protein
MKSKSFFLLFFFVIILSCEKKQTEIPQNSIENTNNIMTQENINVFRNIALGTTLEDIVSREGLPDLIYSGKEYQDNYSFTHLIWANPSTSNSELFEFIENENIQLSENINDIFNNYNLISIHYNNTIFLNYNSTMIMELKNNKLINLIFYLKLIDREMGSNILNYFGNLYGEPERIDRFTLLWKSDNIEIIIKLMPLFRNGEREDFMTIRYSK